VDEIGRELGLELRLTGDAFGPSDHTAFYTRERPVLFFFTGTHGDYHRPTDTWEKINADGLRRVALAAYRVASRLADGETRLTFVKPSVEPSRPRGGGYGPYFGIIPDFSDSPIPGVRLGGVQPGSPANKAGLNTGDIIVKFAGVGVKNLDDLTFALRTRRPGDTVEVTYLRNGIEHSAKATLEQRR
jgi:membrane-associated protease RseP (regulator of RpoE activity)